MFYSVQDIVCSLLEDALKKNELYFIEVYKQEEHYYMKDKLFYETIPLSADTLSKLFGAEHNLYFMLAEGPIPLPYIILRWSEEAKGYRTRFINDSKSGADITPFNPKCEGTARSCSEFFNQLQILIHTEAKKIETAIANFTNNRRYGEWEIENIIARVYEEKLYTPFLLN